MGHTKAENDIAIEQIKKLNEINPLKDYDVDSFVQGMRYGKEEIKKDGIIKLKTYYIENLRNKDDIKKFIIDDLVKHIDIEKVLHNGRIYYKSFINTKI